MQQRRLHVAKEEAEGTLVASASSGESPKKSLVQHGPRPSVKRPTRSLGLTIAATGMRCAVSGLTPSVPDVHVDVSPTGEGLTPTRDHPAPGSFTFAASPLSAATWGTRGKGCQLPKRWSRHRRYTARPNRLSDLTARTLSGEGQTLVCRDIL